MAQVQNIADILHPNYVQPRKEENKKKGLLLASNDLQKKMAEVGRRYGTREQFMQKMSPRFQPYAAQNPERAYFGDAPTLAVVNRTYGDNTATIWLIPQINSVTRFCKDKVTDEVTEELAISIAVRYYYLKTSELMMFFQNYKMAVYGEPKFKSITTALRQNFLEERKAAYAKRVQEEERKKREAWENDDNITYQEYLRRKNLQSNGEKE